MEIYATGTGNKNIFKHSNSSLSLSKEMDQASKFAHTPAQGTRGAQLYLPKWLFCMELAKFYFCIKSTVSSVVTLNTAWCIIFPHRYLHWLVNTTVHIILRSRMPGNVL